jgi:hypothetical protein
MAADGTAHRPARISRLRIIAELAAAICLRLTADGPGVEMHQRTAAVFTLGATALAA